MKKLFMFLCLILCGCSPIKESSYDYEDFIDRHIQFGDTLSFEGDYYVYIYMLRCYHCNQIKNQIFEYMIKYDNLYLLECPEEIKISNDISSTIGVQNVDEIMINGTPTLLEVDNHTLVLNISGSVKIINFLEI